MSKKHIVVLQFTIPPVKEMEPGRAYYTPAAGVQHIKKEFGLEPHLVVDDGQVAYHTDNVEVVSSLLRLADAIANGGRCTLSR